MNLEHLVEKYIASAEYVFNDLKVSDICVNVDVESIREIVESAKAYLEDARYYRNKKEYEVSLTSVAYCEGLLDALRLLGMVKFEWPAQQRKEK